MSDMLEKLLGVEKRATSVITAADAEAKQRVARTRGEAQKKHAALLKQKTAELESAVAAERERLAAERSSKSEEYRARLARMPVDRPAFQKSVRAVIDKGGE
jgi:hypothetical protein